MTKLVGRRIWMSRTVALVVAGTVFHVERADAAAPTATTYIGTLPAEPPARVAIVVEGDAFLAYACGKTDEFNWSASAWFKGSVRDGRIEATADGKTLTATLTDGTVRGTLSADGRDREFTAKPASAKGAAGLYRAVRDVKGDTIVAGWIVDEKHQVVGGCQGKKRKSIAIQPPAPLPPPPPPNQDPPPEQAQQVEDVLLVQVDEEAEVAVQGEKVTSATKPPTGRVVRDNRKK
jgi:hypothetical protein